MTESHVVVVFGSADPNWCSLSHCPSYAYGPFNTRVDAHTFCDSLPEWQKPHILSIRSPNTQEVKVE